MWKQISHPRIASGCIFLSPKIKLDCVRLRKFMAEWKSVPGLSAFTDVLLQKHLASGGDRNGKHNGQSPGLLPVQDMSRRGVWDGSYSGVPGQVSRYGKDKTLEFEYRQVVQLLGQPTIGFSFAGTCFSAISFKWTNRSGRNFSTRAFQHVT